jgi:alginate O-acetyltransferase complex protein AlgI
MWYLNVSMILSLLGTAGVLILLAKAAPRGSAQLRKVVLLLFCVGFLWLYSKQLAVFYIAYSLVNFGLFTLLLRARRGRKALFAFAVLANVATVTAFRLFEEVLFASDLLAPVIMLGLIYNILKAINTMYYAYYIEQKVPFLHYMNYMLFIPTFTSGPILKLKEFHEDLNKPQEVDAVRLEMSVKRIILGLFKKIVLVAVLMAVYEGLLAKELQAYQGFLVLLTYYVMLYFDFSGYSDLAIGFGSLMGFRIPENFKKPFSSPTLTQFWRNWHASLGDWFRDHVFLLVSRRASQSRWWAGVISFGVMLLVGLWHGFNWLFIGWGLYHGILLLLENGLGQTTVNKRKTRPSVFWARCAVTNLFVMFGTIFFSRDLETAGRILRSFLNW